MKIDLDKKTAAAILAALVGSGFGADYWIDRIVTGTVEQLEIEIGDQYSEIRLELYKIGHACGTVDTP